LREYDLPAWRRTQMVVRLYFQSSVEDAAPAHAQHHAALDHDRDCVSPDEGDLEAGGPQLGRVTIQSTKPSTLFALLRSNAAARNLTAI